MANLQTAREFLSEVRVEMSKVSWPSRTELRDSTLVVIVMTIVMAIIVKVLDTVYNLGLGFLFRT